MMIPIVSHRTAARLLAGCAAVFAVSAMMISAPVAAADYTSTGVGLEARTPQPGFPLKLVFSTYDGPLVADVEVMIREHETGKVVLDAASGPWLFADVPPGDYAVWARRSDGSLTSANVSVGETGQETLILSFPPATEG